MDTAQITNTLKGGEFVIADATPEMVFTPEDFSEEQSMVNAMANDFVEQEVFPNVHAMEKKDWDKAVELMKKAGELGLLGIAIPEQYGGAEMDVITGCIAAEQVGRTGSFATTFIAHVGIGTLPILYFGTEEQKQKYLPGLASGDMIGSYCLTEPGSGSDALGAKTTAELSDDGKHWILNGQKMWITNAGIAEVFIVFAKIDGKEFTGFLVDKGTPGLSLGAEEDKMGIKGSSTRQVFFEDCKIPVDNMLGERGKGHKIAFNILNIGRYKLGATATGGAKETLKHGIRYAIERKQFNTPIAEFGAIKYKISEMAIRTFIGETVSYRCARDIEVKEQILLSEGKNLAEALLGGAEEYSIECALAKIIGSEVIDYVVDETVQIHGGMGFSEETEACRAYRDSRIARIYEGTSEINRLLSIDMLFKKAMKGQLDLMTPGMALQKELKAPEVEEDNEGLFAKEAKALSNAKKALLLVAGSAAQKLMAKLKNEQMVIMNAADILIEVYAIESMLMRVMKIVEKRGEEDGGVFIDMLKVYINDAVARINKSGKDALQSFTEGKELKGMLIGLNRLTQYAPVNVKNARHRIADYFIEKENYIV